MHGHLVADVKDNIRTMYNLDKGTDGQDLDQKSTANKVTYLLEKDWYICDPNFYEVSSHSSYRQQESANGYQRALEVGLQHRKLRKRSSLGTLMERKRSATMYLSLWSSSIMFLFA